MPVSMDTMVDPVGDYMAMENPSVPLPIASSDQGQPVRGDYMPMNSPKNGTIPVGTPTGGHSGGGDYMPMNTRPSRATCHRSRSSASRRTFRRRVMRRQSREYNYKACHSDQEVSLLSFLL